MKRRNRVISLAIAAAVTLSGCGVTETLNNELTKAYVPSGDVLVYENGVSKKSDDMVAEGFSLALENDYLQLYIGANYDVAVYEKASGTVTYSNPAYYELSEDERKAISAEMKKVVFSQVTVDYYNSSQKKSSMSSYPDAYSEDKDQVKWEVADDVLTVTYSIGTNMADSLLIQVFTAETYTHYLARLQEMVDSKEIGILDYRAFANMYTEYKYSNMSAEEKKSYSAMYPKLEELETIYVLKSKMTNKQMTQLLSMYSVLEIDMAAKEAENEKLGEYGGNSNPAYFSIPLQYRLSGNDLLVSADLTKIESAEGYYLTQVSFLKNFAATTAADEGYIMVPDGSGCIIENDIATNSMDTITVPFYGEEESREMTEGTSEAIDNSFPVFGLKRNDNTVFAIVENGAAIGGMTAQAHSSYLPYNIAYPYFNYHVMDSFGIEGVSYAFYENVPQTEFTVRYHFLHGKEATYSGMARYYRQYLVQAGALEKLDVSSEDSLPLDIELIGSVAKVVNYVGIPVGTQYPLTTFDEAEQIADLLREGGVRNMNILYTGVLNKGMEHKALSKVKVQKELGGLDGYKKLASALEAQNSPLYTGVDFTKICEKGNGITDKEDVSKYLTRSSVVTGNYDEATGTFSGLFSWLINPLKYAEITGDFIKAFEKVDNKNLYMESIGSRLNANYSQKKGVTRYSTQILVEEMLTSLLDSGYKMKFDVGNDYILKYADSLVNVPAASSHQRIESYSIPFVGMVLKGYIPYTCGNINQAANIETAVLEAVESGAGLHYLLVYEDQLNMQDTNFTQLFSVNYEIHMQDILDNWNKLNDELGYLTNVSITEHEHLTEDVNCVTYENGTKIYVNYGKEAYRTADGIVEAGSWLVKGR